MAEATGKLESIVEKSMKAGGADVKAQNREMGKILMGEGDKILGYLTDTNANSKLSIKQQEVTVQAIRANGIELTKADEKRAIQTQRDFMEAAYVAQKMQLEDERALATGFESVNLGIKDVMLDTKNFFGQKLLDVQEYMATSADFDNVSGAFSQDMSLLTMEMQGLMQVPGMKSIVAGIKYLAAWAAILLKPILSRVMFGDKEKAKEGVISKVGDKIKGAAGAAKKAITGVGGKKSDGSQMSFDFGGDTSKKKEEGSKDKRTDSGLLDLRSHSKVEKGLDKMTKGVEGYTENISGSFSEAFKKSSESTKAMTQGLIDFFTFKSIRTSMATAAKERWKSFKTWMAAQRESFMANTKMGKAMRRGGKLISTGAKALKLSAMALAGSIMGAVAGFLMAALPFLAIVLLVVLIVVGIVLLFKYIMDNWEKIKVKIKMAMDSLKMIGTKFKNWFKDLGGDIAYLVQYLIAKIKDGIAGMANAVIKKLNKWFGLDIQEFEGGNMEELTGEREKELKRRAERDKKLAADFEVKKAERGKELEEAAAKDSERQAEKGYGMDTGSNQANINVQTDNKEVSMTAESTASNDTAATQAMMLIG